MVAGGGSRSARLVPELIGGLSVGKNLEVSGEAAGDVLYKELARRHELTLRWDAAGSFRSRESANCHKVA